MVDIVHGAATCTTELVCDMSHSEVSVRKSKKPFKFNIVTSEKKLITLQVSSNDSILLVPLLYALDIFVRSLSRDVIGSSVILCLNPIIDVSFPG